MSISFAIYDYRNSGAGLPVVAPWREKKKHSCADSSPVISKPESHRFAATHWHSSLSFSVKILFNAELSGIVNFGRDDCSCIREKPVAPNA
jgi:hypothetical protein